MTEILENISNRVLVAFGMYLVYEFVSKFIESNYNLKAIYDEKSIIVQKQPITDSKFNDSIIE